MLSQWICFGIQFTHKLLPQDMGVQLFNHLLLPKEDEATLHTKMANQIHALCMQKGIDGLFVSIPSDLVVDAIQECLDLNIPVISLTQELKLQRI